MTHHDDLFRTIGEPLGGRAGWTLQPSPTPGGAPSWCFEEHGRVLLAVTAESSTISAYLPDGDVEVEFADVDVDAFLGWVTLAGWDLYQA